jgi:acetoin utilization protein AcuB
VTEYPKALMSSAHRIDSFMTKSPVVVERSTSMARALRTMDGQGFRHLPVVDGGQLVGCVSERELKIVENMRGVDSAMCIVGDFILGPPYSVAPDATLGEVVRTMAEKKFGSAVVVEGGQVVGVFTTTDALRALAGILDT